tara:strand:- start:1519 stop:2601 length:1083 start_codon:yes stop_codon:yes gene_type:complete
MDKLYTKYKKLYLRLKSKFGSPAEQELDELLRRRFIEAGRKARENSEITPLPLMISPRPSLRDTHGSSLYSNRKASYPNSKYYLMSGREGPEQKEYLDREAEKNMGRFKRHREEISRGRPLKPVERKYVDPEADKIFKNELKKAYDELESMAAEVNRKSSPSRLPQPSNIPPIKRPKIDNRESQEREKREREEREKQERQLQGAYATMGMPLPPPKPSPKPPSPPSSKGKNIEEQNKKINPESPAKSQLEMQMEMLKKAGLLGQTESSLGGMDDSDSDLESPFIPREPKRKPGVTRIKGSSGKTPGLTRIKGSSGKRGLGGGVKHVASQSPTTSKPKKSPGKKPPPIRKMTQRRREQRGH